MNAPAQPAEAAAPDVWTTGSASRVPYRVYTDEQIYRRELERIFYGPHWSYVGLAAEIPNHGDFKRTFVGEREVIMVRDPDGAINVLENRCAHRGVTLLSAELRDARDFICPYHQWNYDLKGNLRACRSAAA